MTDDRAPAWVREVDFSLVLHPQIMLTGNVRDWYRMPVPPDPADATDDAPAGPSQLVPGSVGPDQLGSGVEWDYVRIGSVLWQLCRRRGYAALATLDPISGALSVPPGIEVPAVLRPFTSGPLDVDQIASLLQAVVADYQDAPIGLMFPYTAGCFPPPGWRTRSIWSSWAKWKRSATSRSPLRCRSPIPGQSRSRGTSRR